MTDRADLIAEQFAPDHKKLIETVREDEAYLYEGCRDAPQFDTLYADKAHARLLAALDSLEAELVGYRAAFLQLEAVG